MGREIVQQLKPYRQLCRHCKGDGTVTEWPDGRMHRCVCPVCEGYGVVMITKTLTTQVEPYPRAAAGVVK